MPRRKPTDQLTEQDLIPFRVAHQAMRRELGAFAGALGRLADGDTARATALASWFAFVERTLHHHHRVEDTIIFPIVAEKDERFATAAAALETDHEQLDPLLKSLRDGLEQLAGAGENFAEIRDDLTERFMAAHELLGSHLDREEEALLPTIYRVGTYADHKAIEKQAQKGIPLSDMAMILPWILAGSAGPDREAMLESIPLPIRVINRWLWEPRFRKVTSPLQA